MDRPVDAVVCRARDSPKEAEPPVALSFKGRTAADYEQLVVGRGDRVGLQLRLRLRLRRRLDHFARLWLAEYA